MPQQQEITMLRGGLDLITPAINVKPGSCISVKNYEAVVRGYRRSDGYERKDGQPAPSEASYQVINFDAGSGAISADDTVTGATSGATGIALYDATVESGSWAGSDAAGFIVVYNTSGTFQDDEALQVSAVTKATANGASIASGASDDDTHNTYIEAVKAARRADIAKVPGSGAIRGLHLYNGDLYAFRDNAGATACVMYKATASGWAAQSFGNVLYFDAGTAEFQTAETLTGGTSGATGTIERIIHQSGTWAGTDAVGYLVLSSVSGDFQDNETITGGTSSGSATSNGADTEIALAAGGRVRCVNHNFYGTSNLYRMYGTTSTGRAFEWDGSVLAPIDTGLSDALDKPKFVGVHANHLLLGYDGGAVQYSGTGLPLSFSANDGAGEVGTGEDITGILAAPDASPLLCGDNTIHYLTGTSDSDFTLNTITWEAGAKMDSAALGTEPLYLDNQGVRRLSSSEAFGDWKRGTLTRMVQPYIEARKNAGASPVGAMMVRSKDQFRIYYDDSEVLIVYLGRKDPEITTLTLGFTPSCVARGEDSNGDEVLFAGASDGWVYQLDRGTSHDGTSFESYVRFPWLHMKAPNTFKRFHALRIELDSGSSDTTLDVAVEYTYGDDEILPKAEDTNTVAGSGGLWDVASWDAFFWGEKVQSSLTVDLDAIGENVSYAIMSDSATESPHTLSSATVNYSWRRENRR